METEKTPTDEELSRSEAEIEASGPGKDARLENLWTDVFEGGAGDEAGQGELEPEALPEKKPKPFWTFFKALITALVVGVGLGYAAMYWFKMRPAAEPKPEPVSIAILTGQSSGSETAAKTRPSVVASDSPSGASAAADSAPVTTQAQVSQGIRILNGGAVPGSAGKAKEFLESQGQKVTEAVNAKGDYVGIAIYYQPENLKIAADLAVILAGKYPRVTLAQAATAEEKSAPIVLILGK